MRILERATLPASPETVWSLLTDWERQASWMPDVAWIRVLGSERGAGTRLQVRTRVFGVPAATDLVAVTMWEPPARLAIEHTGVVKGSGEWRLERAGGGELTAFTWIESFRMPPPVLGDIALSVYAPWQRWMLRRSVANLSRIVGRSVAR
jgi:carbon monoxide dehydrogenase subunit G